MRRIICLSLIGLAMPAGAATIDLPAPGHSLADGAGLIPVLDGGPTQLLRSSGGGPLPPDLAGWPIMILEEKPRDGLLLIQADADQELEILISSGQTSRWIHLFDPDGTYLPGWPLRVPFGSTALYGASFGDVDGDGVGEVVVVTDFNTGGTQGFVCAYAVDGTLLPGFPSNIAGAVVGSPVVVDLDGDGPAEILVTEKTYPTGRLHVLDGGGDPLPGWPRSFDWLPGGSPGAVDVDGDGVREIFFETFHEVHGLRIDGTSLPGWPVTFPEGDIFSYATPTFADVDGDGRPEIAVGSHRSASIGTRGGVWLFEDDGTPVPGWPQFVPFWVYTPPTFADLDRDGDLEVVAGDFVLGGSVNAVYAWHHDGTPVEGWPVDDLYAVSPQIAVADLDGDEDLELVWGDNTQYADGTGRLHAYHHDGTPMAGWPLHVAGSPFNCPVAIGDLDQDGDVELVTVPGNALEDEYTIYVWDLPGSPDSIEMPMHRYGPGRDGVYRGTTTTVGVAAAAQVRVGGPRLGPIPNPARPGVIIPVQVDRGPVRVDVLDVSGRRVATLVDGLTAEGWTRIPWDGRDDRGRATAGGTYVVRVKGPGGETAETLVLVR